MAENVSNTAIFIAYGSNLSAGQETASQAFARLVKYLEGRLLIVNKISHLWSSKAWPNPADPPYVNAVLQITTDMHPVDLMQVLHEIEHQSGRVRDGSLNAPRVLDLDLIAYGDVVLEGADGLTLPHPRAADRAFVMGPLAEIAPDWVHPVKGRTARELYAEATIARDAYPLADFYIAQAPD